MSCDEIFGRAPHHTLSVFLLSLVLCAPAFAEVGTPCEDEVDCVPGEICLNHPEGNFCTRRCAGNPCPEGYFCDTTDRVPVCDRPGPPPGQIGEGCENQCEETLFCAQDGDEQYCSRGCTGPGSCPAGMRCAGGDTPTCALLRGAPGYGEPCADGACAEGLVCAEGAERALPYCTIECEGDCPQGLSCGEGSLCRHAPAELPLIGGACVPEDAQEPTLVGCADGLRCTLYQIDSWCSRPCSRNEPCPEGMGCIQEDPMNFDEGWCYPDQDDSPGLEPAPAPRESDPPSPPGPNGGAGADYGMSPAGGGSPDADSPPQENSCQQLSSLSYPFVLLLFLSAPLLRRRWNQERA